MSDDRLSARLARFNLERDWDRFHTPKNLAMALAAEAGELLAEFQWLTPDEAEQAALPGELRDRVVLELADVRIYLQLLADALNVDLTDVSLEKVTLNESRFPPARDGSP